MKNADFYFVSVHLLINTENAKMSWYYAFKGVTGEASGSQTFLVELCQQLYCVFFHWRELCLAFCPFSEQVQESYYKFEYVNPADYYRILCGLSNILYELYVCKFYVKSNLSQLRIRSFQKWLLKLRLAADQWLWETLFDIYRLFLSYQFKLEKYNCCTWLSNNTVVQSYTV